MSMDGTAILSSYQFAYPWMLALLPLVLLAAVWHFMRRKENHQAHTRISHLGAIRGHSLRGLLRMYLLPLLRILSLALIVVALARPQKVLKKQNIKGEGIDINLVMDISGSMLSKDLEPNRLEASKKVAADFIDKRQFDRVGLVVYAGVAYTLCPPTTDYRVLKEFLENLNFGQVFDGTAIGMGLATAVNRMKDSNSESKIIVLLTDGMNNSGYYGPLEAANMAKALGIRVYTIGVGSRGIALSPARPLPGGGYEFRPQQVEIDEALLEEISRMTGGKYFRATDNASLGQIYDDINRLEKTEYEVTTIERETEAFHTLVMWAIILLLLEMTLRYTFLRTFL